MYLLIYFNKIAFIFEPQSKGIQLYKFKAIKIKPNNMQTQRQQLNLFSSTPLSYDNMSKLKKCMEDHYHYNVDQIDMKVNNGEGRGSIIVIRGYSANFIEKFVPCLSTIKEETEQTVSELETELSDIISHINGQLDYSMNAEFNIENCSILCKHLQYTALKQTCFSIYTGKNDFTLSFKWLKNNKPEGRKTDIKLNNGDAYVLFMDHSDEYTIGESSSESSTKKASTKKKTTKKQKNPLNDTKVYTSRELFVNGKSGDVIKGKNGSKLRVAIHKETREVFKKVEENWTDEGHAKFTELFPDGKAVNKKAKKPANKKEVKKKAKKPATKKKEVKPKTEVKKQEPVETQNISQEVDSMPDELEDDLDMDDIQSVASDINNGELNDMEEMVLDGSDNEEQDKPNESDNENQSEAEEEEEEEVKVSDVDELQPDIYTEQCPTKDNDNHLLPTILNLKLHLYIVPETETLCDEYNRKEDRKVFLLFNKDINELSLGKEHRIGNRIYGIDTEYPIYNVLTM